MDLVHYASEYNIQADEYYKTPDFLTFGLNFTYSDVVKKGMSFEINVGVKNITNSYQNNFDHHNLYQYLLWYNHNSLKKNN